MVIFFTYYLLGISLIFASLFIVLVRYDKISRNVRVATALMALLGIGLLTGLVTSDNYRGRESLRFFFEFYAMRNPTPRMGLGETGVVLGVYNSVNPEREGERIFVVRLPDGQEVRLNSKNFIKNGDVGVQVGDQLVRLREGIRPLNRSLPASSQ